MSIETDLWADILSSADRGSRARNAHRRKNVILLSERHRGRTYLLEQLSVQKKGGRKVKSIPDLAVGYHVLEVKEDGDEDSVPPVSIFYPPNSQENLLKLVPKCLPPESIMDTAVLIALDWSKPSTMVRELLTWLRWVARWIRTSAKQDEQDELRERLQHHVQNYSEPSSSTSYQASSSYAGSGAVLPLGQGVLTMNLGIPIVVVCTRADRMDVVGDELGMKGQWEERTDWVQQALRTICLSYGAALFYTSTSQPQTYTFLRQYLLHRLFTSSPATRITDSAQPAIPTSSPFAFPHKANVLDRDAVMVPTGWDSYGKISVLRDRFDAGRVYKAWESSLQDPREEGVEGIEDVWDEVIPDTTAPKVARPGTITSTSESEQTFLSRQLDILQKDPNRDPRASFRQAAAAVSAQGAGASADGAAGVVGPMGAGGLSLPGVEKVMAEMEGSSVEDMKEKFARLGRRDGATKTGPLSPTGEAAKPAVPNEALHNFFQGLLATKGKSSPSSSSKSPSADKTT